MQAKPGHLGAFLFLATSFFFATLSFFATPALSQKAWTAAQVIEFVDSQIKLKGDDRATAEYLRGVKLTQKLDIGEVENLQGKGAGVRTLEALGKLSQDSASLPAAPAPPPPPPPTPPPSAKEQADI